MIFISLFKDIVIRALKRSKAKFVVMQDSKPRAKEVVNKLGIVYQETDLKDYRGLKSDPAHATKISATEIVYNPLHE